MNFEKYAVISNEIKEILATYNEKFLASNILQDYVPSNFQLQDFNLTIN